MAQPLLHLLKEKVIGQSDGLSEITRFVRVYQAGLSPDGRPAGVFLLMGPTGTGKTRTVEALAEVLHGSPRNVLRIDCGEFQMDHEVAKLIGAPPGYLGHRETQPVLTQMKLNQVMSDRANIAIVLFDEIEKASPSIFRILLGVLDKGTLRLGDNTTVNFERTLIFFTSNLGYGKQIVLKRGEGMAFALPVPDTGEAANDDIVSSFFSPEFRNRIDAIVTYKSLSKADISKIFDIQLDELRQFMNRRVSNGVNLRVSASAKRTLIERGFSDKYGARHLKRLIQRELISPIADLILQDGRNTQFSLTARKGQIVVKAEEVAAHA